MLAMVSRTFRGVRQPASSLTTFASMLAPTGIGDSCDIQVGWQAAFAFAFHHSTGRALARLQLLILICLPLRKAEWRFCAVGNPAGCRVSRARPWMADRGGPTEQDRSEGTPSPGEGPDAGAKPFASFSASGKGSRRKGETISSRYRSNGYVHLHNSNLVGPKAAKVKAYPFEP
jgi:hypothetical protein